MDSFRQRLEEGAAQAARAQRQAGPARQVLLASAGWQRPQAFLLCAKDWQEEAAAQGDAVFAWRDVAWAGAVLWAFDPEMTRLQAPEHLQDTPIQDLLMTVRCQGYDGPATLPGAALWAGVPARDYDVASPLGRCRLMAAIMRSRPMRQP